MDIHTQLKSPINSSFYIGKNRKILSFKSDLSESSYDSSKGYFGTCDNNHIKKINKFT